MQELKFSKKIIFYLSLQLVLILVLIYFVVSFGIKPAFNSYHTLKAKEVELAQDTEQIDNNALNNANNNLERVVSLSLKQKAKLTSLLFKLILDYNLSVEDFSQTQQLLPGNNIKKEDTKENASILDKTLSLVKSNQDLNSPDIQEVGRDIYNLKIIGDLSSIINFLIFLDKHSNIFDIVNFSITKEKSNYYLQIQTSFSDEAGRFKGKLSFKDFKLAEYSINFRDSKQLNFNSKENKQDSSLQKEKDIPSVLSSVEQESNLSLDSNLDKEQNIEEKHKDFIKYKGFISENSGKTAIIDYKGKTYFLSKGDYIADYRLYLIRKDYILLKDKNNRERVINRHE